MERLTIFIHKLRFLKFVKCFAKTLIIFISVSGYSFAGNYPLEVIQPQEGLDIKNRFYKAYPEVEYNVRMAVIGGKFPFFYQLTNSPEGMEIKSATGEITWPNPPESEEPYNVSATVTDSNSKTQSVSWTILVTKEGFIFVDALNGKSGAEGGTGTISNPWKSLKDIYGGDTYADKNSDHRKGEFVYWRAGTYEMNGYISDDGWDGLQLTMRSDSKPQVWLAYPGYKMPVISQRDAHLYFEGDGRDLYIDGLDIRSDGNPRAMGIKISSAKDNVVLRRNKFSGITGGEQGGNNSLVFINLWGTGQYYAIQDNHFSGVDTGYGILNYNTKNVLVENNFFTAIGDHPVGMKVRSERWWVRSNIFRDNPKQSIELHYNNKNSALSGDIEISHNVVESGGGRINVNQSHEAKGLPVNIFRNTFMDQANQKYVTSENGPFYWKNNVIINESTSKTKINTSDISAADRLIITDNLTGAPWEGIVDNRGNLIGEYKKFIGTRGHLVGNLPNPPVLEIDR